MLIEIHEDEFEEWQVSSADRVVIKRLAEKTDSNIYRLDVTSNLDILHVLSAEGLGFIFQMVFELGFETAKEDLIKDVINTLQKAYGVHYVN